MNSDLPNLYEQLKEEILITDLFFDIGCASGDYMMQFEPLFRKFRAIDIKDPSKKILENFKKLKNHQSNISTEHTDGIPFNFFNEFQERFEILKNNISGNIKNYTFKSDEISFILCKLLLHFFDDLTKLELIDKFYDALQTKGLMYLEINHTESEQYRNLEEVEMLGKNHFQAKYGECNEVYPVEAEEFFDITASKYPVLKKYKEINNDSLIIVIRK